MAVQLGIVRPAREVGERGCDDPGDVLFDDPVLARTRVEYFLLRVGDDVVDRLSVTVRDDISRLVVGESPEDRERFRGAEAKIEAGDRGTPGPPRKRSDRLATHGIGAGDQHVPEVLLAHLRAALEPFAAVEIR